MIDLNQIKKKLEKEKEEIKLLLEGIVKETEEAIEESVSASDELADKYEYKQEKHLEEDFLRKRLMKIEKALQRIKDGTYGFCQKCHQEIEKTRIEIDPAVDLCRKCSLEVKSE